jgi:stage II sporulation protein D
MPSRSYLRSVKDNVHDEDMEWTLSMSIAEMQTALERSGRTGQLKNVQIAKRSKSGRAAFVKLSGMQPDRISGDQLRAAVGFAKLRSTAFSVKKKDDGITFTGKGYGHGVGMCVIGHLETLLSRPEGRVAVLIEGSSTFRQTGGLDSRRSSAGQ